MLDSFLIFFSVGEMVSVFMWNVCYERDDLRRRMHIAATINGFQLNATWQMRFLRILTGN